MKSEFKMDNKTQRKILKFFLAIYLVSFFVINWNDVSWIFNYRAVSSLVYNFFNPYQTSSISAATTNENSYETPVPTVSVQDGNSGSNYANSQNDIDLNKQVTYTYSEQSNIIDIPAISIKAPIVFPTTTDVPILQKYLDKGVILYPTSAMPGKAGQTIILGHSAPENWPIIRYDWVFSKLNDLKAGDDIKVTVDHKQYAYTVTQKKIINKGEEVSFGDLTNSENRLILVSCWPPGKDYKRILVEAKLK